MPKIHIIGDIINNAYARARRAFEARELTGYQDLARHQADKGAAAIDINIDGTQRIMVRQPEMLEFLPKLVPALQAATDVPLCFDNPNVEYHRTALAAFDRSKSRGKPILNSLAASRQQLDRMLELIREHDMRCIVMASEKFMPGGGSSQSFSPQESYETVKKFVDLLATKAGRTLDDIIVDPGLAPVGADTYGLVRIGLETMQLVTADPHLRGIHFSVGLSNFAWGTPKAIKPLLEQAYLTLGARVGLDMALANVEHISGPLPEDHPLVAALEDALNRGRPAAGETVEAAGFRQAELIMNICAPYREE
jgi:5-methyltetrahydrofolate--homocysteine methyltransferase